MSPVKSVDPALPVDVTGRPLMLRPADLDRFFRPRTVAVIGASDTEGRPGARITAQLRAWSERVGATMFPVNPKHAVIGGQVCHPDIASVPEVVDLAVILVGDPQEVLADLAAAGVSFAVVFAAGFAESGAAGAEAQARLTELIDGGPLRLLGPNTNLNAFEEFRTDLDGKSIALITQSGHQGRPVFASQEIGIKVSHWAPVGNEADLETADFIRYFADQPEVGVIACYIEGFKDGRTFALAADHAAQQRKPIVMVKVGRTESGAKMAASHTGKLTGQDRVASAVFRQFGVTRVDGLDELIDTSQMFARTSRPKADGVCVYSISGGTGAHMADLAAAQGLSLPQLAPGTQESLREWIPGYLTISNPVDNGGHPAGDERGRKIIDAILADPNIGVLVCPITGAFPPMSDKLAQDLVDAAEATDKVVCVIWGSPVGDESAYRDILLKSSRIVVFRTFGNCVTALRAYFDYHRFRDNYTPPFDDVARTASPAAAKARRLLTTGKPLSEHSAKQLLRTYGIRVPREQLVTSAAAAVRAAGLIGYPVVMKACAPQLPHKSDLGLVKLGLRSASQVRDAYREIVDAARDNGAGRLEGVLVCQQVDKGVEMVVGIAHDELFGPTVTVGLGGIFVEVFDDIAIGVPPFGPYEVRRMLGELRGLKCLQGLRGQPAADLDALVDVVMRVQRMALELGDDLAELDINPLMVMPRGGGTVALDALAIPK
ncbi:acetate--CoA ligase family protein [Yinghuangia seranimata]|uniref:acetate--CoA ligase family protein n=1 Tax=Yinghuangia seranimata TaxID=408067 RepID=UPI00248C6020|nr:acetate--CoA ligase family protein [Yinghuangia seranimata]MDI2130319.1 acetate--CoA ligase family protein [Yinghuangia seranimata]